MQIRAYILLATVACLNQLTPAYANNNNDTLYASGLKPYGRYIFDDRNELELISSAVHFGFAFEGRECALYISIKNDGDHNYLQYELDGVYQKRIRVNGYATIPLIIKAVGTGKHTVWIYKATEAHTGPVVISKIVAPHIQAISVSKAPLIEFIGNSITCGAQSDTSDAPCGTGQYQDYHNAYMAYGPRVARELGANYILSSVSGIGIYRTWNMEGPSMPQVYENIDFQVNTTDKYNFKNYSPHIVSIALGTNDLSNGDGKTPRKPFEPTVFVSNFVSFVKLVKSKYPEAQIALLSSPMLKGASRDVLEKCLTIVKTQIDAAYPLDKPLSTFFFPPMDAHGCAGHPSVEDQLILAKQLQPFFQKLLRQ